MVTFFVALAVASSLVGLGARFFTLALDWTRQNALAEASDKAVGLGRWIHPGAPRFEDLRRGPVMDGTSGLLAGLLDATGTLHATNASRSFTPGLFDVPPEYRTNGNPWREPHTRWIRKAPDHPVAAAWYPIGSPDEGHSPPAGWTVAVVDVGDFGRRAADLRAILATRVLSITFGLSVVTYLALGFWTRHLSTAADTAEALVHGDLNLERLAIPTADSELRRLLVAFNKLLDRLREMHRSQQQFVADAAHELRTPLTILRGEIQVALRQERDASRYQAVLGSNLDEVLRLSRLVENLLILARCDAGQPVESPESIPLAELCRSTCRSLEPASAAAGIPVEVVANGEPVITGNPVAVSRIVYNLVDNALRHSGTDRPVVVRVGTRGTDACIEVIDAGRGMDAGQLSRVFERFYRADRSRNRSTAGSGLGLSIAKALADAHGGRIEVSSRVGEGTTFSVLLPLRGAPGVNPTNPVPPLNGKCPPGEGR